MKKTKELGIWLDHANAHLIEYTAEAAETEIDSKFTHQEKEQTLHRSETIMHNKEQHQLHEYFLAIAEKIRDYDEVLLFGPTDAKLELFNILRADHHFDKIKIETRQADKMTQHEQHDFVRDYFSAQQILF